MRHKTPTFHATGATLIELLVLIGVISILTLITIVGLRSVKRTQLDMKDLHNLRLSGMDIITWAHDNDEVLLTAGAPGSGLYQQQYGGGQSTPAPDAYAISYWGVQNNWNRMLARFTNQAQPHWQSAYGLRVTNNSPYPDTMNPRAPEYPLAPSLFYYSCTFVTKPSLWVDPAFDLDLTTISTFFTTVRVSQIAHPSGKGLMIHPRPPVDAQSHHVAFVDGSASSLPESAFLTAAPRPLGNPTKPGLPVIDTAAGFLGRDR
jgi:hypothetical protein